MNVIMGLLLLCDWSNALVHFVVTYSSSISSVTFASGIEYAGPGKMFGLRQEEYMNQ